MTEEEFDAVLPRLGRLTLDTVRIARQVLVEGSPPGQVAKSNNITRQRVHGIVTRFQQEAQQVPRDWRKVEVWLPPNLADEVEALAEQARKIAAGGAPGT